MHAPKALGGLLIGGLLAAMVAFGRPAPASKPFTLFLVNGSGPAAVTILDGPQERSAQVALPFRESIGAPRGVLVLEAQTTSAAGDASVTCRIAVPGRPAVVHSASGPYAATRCVS